MWREILTTREVEYCQALLRRLEGVTWCAPLVERVKEVWPPTYTNKALLFELRFAFELHDAGIVADYEFHTAVGDSSVDFRVVTKQATWLIELVSVMSSDAVRDATLEVGIGIVASLGSNARDPRQSIAGEMILAQQKIGEKAVTKDGPTKFPPIVPGTYHAIVADVRG